jgi:hypothetical protein
MLRVFGILAAAGFVAIAALLAWALTLGGFRVEDPEMEEALYWAREFKAEQPELSRAIAKQCEPRLTASPYSRDGALQLFQCIRAEAEAQGHA